MPITHPLRDLHITLGARLGEFAGWEVPLSYSSIKEEHLAVRSSVGLFDLTHMGRIFIYGKGADEFLSRLVPKKIEDAEPGTMPGPTALLNENAGFIDDIMPYKLSEDEWLLAVNASNRKKDIVWLAKWKDKLGYNEVKIADYTFDYALLALQGPKSVEIIENLGAGELSSLKPLTFVTNYDIGGVNAFLISRSGWTGEDGFEFILKTAEAAKLFEKIVKEHNVTPCGLGARDSLRMEIGFVLAGDDINEEITPIDARYWLVFDYGKQECIPCPALQESIRRGARQVRVGIKLKKKDRRIPRKGYKIYLPGSNQVIGEITSGSYSPLLDRGIGQAYVEPSHALIGLKVELEIRGKRAKAKIVDFPFINVKG